MDFKKIFDTYSNNLDTAERSNEFAEIPPMPADVLQQVQDFIQDFDSNKKDIDPDDIIEEEDNDDDDGIEIPDPVADAPPAPIPSDILDGLSQLDQAMDLSFDNSNNPVTNTPDEVDEIDEETEESEFVNFDEDFNLDEDLDEDLGEELEEELTDDLDEDITEANDFLENDDIETSEEDFAEDLNEAMGEDLLDDISDNLDDTEAEEILPNDEDLDENFDEEIANEKTETLDEDLDEENLADAFDEENLAEDENFDEETPANDEVATANENLGEENLADDDDLDISDFMNNFDDDDSGEEFNEFDEDVEESVFTEEISDPILDNSDQFDIELPEEFNENIVESEEEFNEAPEEDASLEVPDFSNTEANMNSLEVPATSLATPTAYEEVDKSLNFNIWDKQEKNNSAVELALTQEQTFKIRYKINSFVDQDLRFKIREIIADPESYTDIYEKLTSLLLIDVPESVVQNLLAQLNNADTTDTYQVSEASVIRSTFHAHDVADYQDSIYRLKTEFLYNIKKYSLYGLIVLLSGIIAWFGFAQPVRINSLFSKGLVEVQKENFIEGEALFQQATAIAGEPVAEWFVKYADVYNNKNLITEAERKYLSAVAIEPQNISIATNVSSFYTNLGPKYYTNAIAIIERLTTYHPNKFEVWDDLGSLLINYSDFFIDDRDKQTELLYKAADVYQQYIMKNPKDAAPYYRMVDIYIRIGNKDQVDFIASLITKLNPKYINLSMMNRLAKYYTDQRELTKSERVLRQITPMLDTYYNKVPELQKLMSHYYNIDPLEISNILSSSYYEFARYKMLSYDVKSAGVLLTNSISFNPEHGENYNLLGELYLYSPSHESDKLVQAKKLFDQALAVNPENYKAHINLGHMYYMWDKEFGNLKQTHDTAAFHYRIAKSMMPDSIKNSLLSYNYGWLEYQNNNPEEAINSWSEIYKETPNNAVLSYALGSALYKIGNPQLAQMELTKAADTFQVLKDNIPQPDLSNKRHTEIYTQLAKTYNNLGVINANYGAANANRKDYFDSQALLNFYNAQDISDQLNTIYSTAEYNIGVITRPNIRNRQTIFDDAIPKQTSIENPKNEFNKLLLQNI